MDIGYPLNTPPLKKLPGDRVIMLVSGENNALLFDQHDNPHFIKLISIYIYMDIF